MCEKIYSSKDVETIAEIILNNWEDHNTTSGYLCHYCYGHVRHNIKPVKIFEGFNHGIDCPVFIAQDLLTK